MSKKNLLISAALTTFVLVVLANVSAVYAQIRNTAAIQPTPAATETIPAPNLTVQVTPQEAATIASNFLGKTDLYSVETAAWNGVDAYKVVFSSGTIVYISMDGLVIGTEAPQPVFVSAPAQNNNNQSQQVSAPTDHQGHDSYEEHEGHDD